jgi:hypothetical protein
MEVKIGDKIKPKIGDDASEDTKDVELGAPCHVIIKILEGKQKEFKESDMDDMHNHWLKCRRKWLNVSKYL